MNASTGPLRVRRDVWKLAAWDPILLWYARAVADMRTRPLSDPTSWRYQAAIHDYVRSEDPLAQPTDSLPGDRDRFWSKCQHFSWFFLPWHRMYLHCFEQIVADTVVKLGGASGWALPYWNYSDRHNADALKLPVAFRDKTTPDGVPNPLRVQDRLDGWNDGVTRADENDVALSCLTEGQFDHGSTGARAGFGGPVTKFNHGSGGAGQLEATPHGTMHTAVGGWMSEFNTAGLDPIFWLHHANVDRLWPVWSGRDHAFVNPADAGWLNFPFEFHDSSGAVVQFTCSQVVDTTAALLGYRYEDVSDPLHGQVAMGPAAAVAAAAAMTSSLPAEMVGASTGPIVLSDQPTTARIALHPPTGPASALAMGVAHERRVFLKFENITGHGRPTSYSVYVNVDPAADPAQRQAHFAGVLPMFGVRAASRPGAAPHAGSGLTYTLEVTQLEKTLRGQGAWSEDALHVAFVPRAHDKNVSEIAVGKVSVYYE